MLWEDRRLRRRNRKGERGAPTDFTLDPDVSTVCLDDAFCDREPEAGTESTGPRRCLPEAIEQMRQGVGSDAHAGVGHRKHRARILSDDPHCDPAPAWGELDGIADQIFEDLQESLAITPDSADVRRRFQTDFDRRYG